MPDGGKSKYKYKNTCDTGQTRNKLLEQWVLLTNHTRARMVVVGVAGRGGLRWWRGTRVAVVCSALLAETAVGC